MSAFVTDGFWRKSVAAVRGLGRAGIAASVGESTRLAPALWSRFAAATCVYPSPWRSPDRFIARLAAECTARGVRTLIVPEEETLAVVLGRAEALPAGTKLIGGPRAAFERARDKWHAIEAARALGLPVPWTRAPTTEAERVAAVAEAPLPAVVKPRVGSGAKGVRYVATREALAGALADVERAHGPALIQERLPAGAEGIGTSLLLDDEGRVRASFAHRRLREYPVTGGAATLAESIHAPDLVDAAAHLCQALGLTGFAMVEWRRDLRDGVATLLEVNPRLWGSLALAIEAGVNFPALAHAMATGAPPAPPPTYRAGARCRFLVPGDVMHYLRNPARARLDPPFWRFGGNGPWWDEWSPDDPGPAFGRIASLWPLLTRAEWRRFL